MIAIYARVSTEEQARHGYSIPSQLRLCKEKAKGIDPLSEIKEYVDKGVSGEFIDRPALNKLRKDAMEGLISKVICYDPDRFSRKLINQLVIVEEFDKRNIDLIFVDAEYKKTPEGQLLFSMRGSISEFEKAKIKERMMRGRREKASQGKILSDYHIYGYSYDKKHHRLIINEEEAAVVRLIFNLFTEPNDMIHGINSIAAYLTQKKIPTKKDVGVWHRQVVHQILQNKAFIGEFYQNKWNSEGMLANKTQVEEYVPIKLRPRKDWIFIPCPPIVERNQFDYAQTLLKESRRRWAKQSKHSYLLSGLIRCGECNNTMTGRQTQSWGNKFRIYTDQKNYSGAKFKGCGMKINCSDLDEIVWGRVVEWLKAPEMLDTATQRETTQKLSYEEAELARLEKEIKKNEAAKKRLLKLYAESEDDIIADIKKSLRELVENDQMLNAQLEEIREELANQSKIQDSENILKVAAEYYLSRDGELTNEDKKQLVRSVVREIRVFKEKVEIYGF